MEEKQPKPKKNWKKIIVVGIIATITPGGFIALGAYAIKKMMDKRKKDAVDT